MNRAKESEETEVKDIEWLRNEIKKLQVYTNNPMFGKFDQIRLWDVEELINQLDEPEVNSQIDKLANFIMSEVEGEPSQNQGAVDTAIRIIKSYQNQEVLSKEWIDENEVFIFDLEDDCEIRYIPSLKLRHLLVPEQELPVIPKFAADFIKVRKGTDAYSLQYIFCTAMERSETDQLKKEYDWIRENDETFARAWLDGFTVEEEQKYYVVKSEGLDGVHYYFTKFDDEMNGLFTLPNDKKRAYRFDDKEKAQAIANYTDSKVEELEE